MKEETKVKMIIWANAYAVHHMNAYGNPKAMDRNSTSFADKVLERALTEFCTPPDHPDVRRLRAKTGASMKDCHRFLVDALGDFDTALGRIHRQGMAGGKDD